MFADNTLVFRNKPTSLQGWQRKKGNVAEGTSQSHYEL